MSDHSRALVPIESWLYASPELIGTGRSVDIGLLAEALIYYDRVIFNLSNQLQLAELISWFWNQHCYADFLALVADGTFQICEYSFVSTAVFNQESGKYHFLNIQDPEQMIPNSFEQRFLYHPKVQASLPNARAREQLYRAFRGRVIEEKASEFSNAIDNARADVKVPERLTLVVQAIFDEVYRLKGVGRPPEVAVEVKVSDDGSTQVNYNVDFNQISKLMGRNVRFDKAKPLIAAIQCNRFLWSSAKIGCDLFMPKPMGVLIGDKLYESGKSLIQTKDILESLQTKVEFPDIRNLINNGQLTFTEVLKIRGKAIKFRQWLQSSAERDRDQIIAYHNELGEELGMQKMGSKTLKLFGIVGGPALGALIGSTIGDTSSGGVIGASSGAGFSYLSDLAAKIKSDWRPVVFGDWLKERISKVIQKI